MKLPAMPLARFACAAVAGVLAGCGGDRAPTGKVASCIERFNALRAGDMGKHAYDEHAARKAQVTTIDGGCAVIFVVAPDDEEFGAVGEMEREGGWVSTAELGAEEARRAQEGAATSANADVDAEGRLTED